MCSMQISLRTGKMRRSMKLLMAGMIQTCLSLVIPSLIIISQLCDRKTFPCDLWPFILPWSWAGQTIFCVGWDVSVNAVILNLERYVINFSFLWWFLQDRPLEQREGEDFADHRQDSADLQVRLHHAQLCAVAADSPERCLLRLLGQICLPWHVTGQVSRILDLGQWCSGGGPYRESLTKLTQFSNVSWESPWWVGKLYGWIHQTIIEFLLPPGLQGYN